MRVLLDANILFSASQPHSRMCALLEIILSRAQCLTNAYAIEEARRNLESKCPAALPQLLILLKKCEVVSGLTVDLDVQLKDKDVPILGGAISGKATHLLTGDQRDFGVFFGKTVQGVKIMSPAMLSKEMVSVGWLSR